jgi:N-acetyl-1-D-myo-inositol-2-amino-2-deoxy-alpha-D-glucopyranoside deacetylase
MTFGQDGSVPEAARRLLLVHAHPDDETIVTGGVMARYAEEGAHVVLVTCTRGEHGEIVARDLQYLDSAKLLADERVEELARAMAVLGVEDHRFLGPYEDSGMMGTPENERPTAFWQADLEEAAGHLALVVDEVRPQVVVTYDPTGGYGHPDHIQAHRVTLLALEQAEHEVTKVYHVLWGGRARKEREATAYDAAGRPGDFVPPEYEHIAPEEEAPATTRIDVSAYVERKLEALRCHRTQLTVVDRWFALSNNVAHLVLDEELFTLARGPEPSETETDLFAGVTG